MLKASWLIAAKDLRLSLRGSQGLAQTVLMGLLLIFVFSLSRNPGEPVPALSAAAIFWLSSMFAQVLVYNSLYGLEEHSGARLGLVMAPSPPQSVWLGKALAGTALLLICQAVFAVAVVAFLGQNIAGSLLWAAGCILVVDVGLAAMGSLMGALASGKSSRESLLTVVLFPLLIPVLLAGIRLLEAVILGKEGAVSDWLGLAAAFGAVFAASALVLFPHLYTGEQ